MEKNDKQLNTTAERFEFETDTDDLADGKNRDPDTILEEKHEKLLLSLSLIQKKRCMNSYKVRKSGILRFMQIKLQKACLFDTYFQSSLSNVDSYFL